MQIFMRSFAGKTLTIDVDESGAATIDDVMSMIRRKEDSSSWSEQSRLIFARKQLEDGRRLAEYGVEKDSMVHVACRRGYIIEEPYLLQLALKYREKKMVCHKCYPRLPPRSTHCRKKCGHTNQVRQKKFLNNLITCISCILDRLNKFLDWIVV